MFANPYYNLLHLNMKYVIICNHNVIFEYSNAYPYISICFLPVMPQILMFVPTIYQKVHFLASQTYQLRVKHRQDMEKMVAFHMDNVGNISRMLLLQTSHFLSAGFKMYPFDSSQSLQTLFFSIKYCSSRSSFEKSVAEFSGWPKTNSSYTFQGPVCQDVNENRLHDGFTQTNLC